MNLITIGDKKYKVHEAKTEQELKEGLSDYKELQKDEGMLFYLDEGLSLAVFNTVKMLFPIDIIFINQDLDVVDIKENCEPGLSRMVSETENLDEDDYLAYVLEVNANSGIKVGDNLDFDDEKLPVMKVLFPDGSELMPLYGGERIFSRANTRILIKKAKKAAESLSDKDYKALGTYMFKCIRIQDNREPEYVSLDTNK